MKVTFPLPAFPAGESDLDSRVLSDYIVLHSLLQDKPTKLSFVESGLRTSSHGNIDNLVVDTRSELDRRIALLGTEAPFTFLNDTVSPSSRMPDAILYAFFAALALDQNIDNDGRKKFEDVVAAIMQHGVGLRSISIGFPRRSGVEPTLRAAFQDYAIKINEKYYPENIVEYAKDMSLDVASWYPFPDGRGSYIAMLGQCATGEDWEAKVSDLNVTVLRRVIDYTSEPLRYVAIPHYATHRKNKYKKLSIQAGVLLDRPRLWHLSSISEMPKELIADVTRYLLNLY